MSPAERCDFVGVKLEKVHELFQVCHICGKGVVFYNMAQYGLLLGFTHVIRLALGGQAKSEHGYRIELITYHSY